MLPFGENYIAKNFIEMPKIRRDLALALQRLIGYKFKALNCKAGLNSIKSRLRSKIRFKFWIETHQELKRYLPVKSKISARRVKPADARTRRLIDHIDRSKSPDRARAIPSDIFGIG